jgi:broad specificity phosphatase PhoE
LTRRAAQAPLPATVRLPALLAVILSALMIAPPSALAQAGAWEVLRQPGIAVFMRHSDAPGSGGFGDPAGFRLEDCATQRNLSEEGRAHAHRTGEALRKNGISFDRVLTSPWCRCKETAALAMGRDAEVFEPLSNLVGRSERREPQVKALRGYLAGLGNSRALLVTHGTVISALTGIQPAQGEMIVIKPGAGGDPNVVGRLRVE